MTKIFPEGIITAVVTPVTADQKIDHDLLFDHCSDLVAQGGAGIVLMGTTGEANSFSCNEREAALEQLISRGFPAHQVMVSTGTCALSDTVRLSKHATDLGVGGLLIMPPFFYRPITDAGLFEYFSEVVNRVDSDLKIYLYHFPRMSGCDMSVELILRLRQAFPDVFCGMKDSSGDLDHMLEIMSNVPDFAVYSGTERYVIEVLKSGGRGCISATTNCTLTMVLKAYQCYTENRPAEIAVAKMLAGRTAFEGHVFAAAIKGIMARRKNNGHWNRLRPPLVSLPESVLDEIEAELAAIQPVV